MSIITKFEHGNFYLPAYCSGDINKARTFYTSLFGWEAGERAMGDGTLTTLNINGNLLGNMYEMSDESKNAGVRAHWNSYLVVDSVDEIINKIEDLGGKLLRGPMDAEGNPMVNLQDPHGAKFSAWENHTNESLSTVMNEVGALCWTELIAHDREAAKKFYAQLIGWEMHPFEGSPMPYTVFNVPGSQPIGGIFERLPEMGDIPSQWIPYFHVTDADETARKAEELGGTNHGLIDVKGAGRIAMLQDSEGGAFAIIRPEMP